jgi:hypothetical protein
VRFRNVCSAALAGAELFADSADVFELKKSKYPPKPRAPMIITVMMMLVEVDIGYGNQ